MTGGAPWVLSQVQVVAEAVATVAFALSGVIEGARKRLDAVGICVVGGLAAFGGGTVRDLILDRRPLFWVQHAGWLWALLALCIAAMVFMRARHLEPTERAMQWPDAIGLGLFTASGTQIALDSGMPAIVAVLLGMVTAVFGGVLRDVVCNEIPRAFNDHRPYAVCSFAGGWKHRWTTRTCALWWTRSTRCTSLWSTASTIRTLTLRSRSGHALCR